MHCIRIVFAFTLLFGIACADDDPVAPAADASTAPIGYLMPCVTANDTCDTTMDLVCFAFNNKGPHCTHSCVQDAEDDDCEAPSPGCSGMGVCKVP